MESMFSDLGIDADEREKLRRMRAWVDGGVEGWWIDTEKDARESGEPIESWVRFLQALHLDFQRKYRIPPGSHPRIQGESPTSESMDDYLHRALGLFLRLKGQYSEESAILDLLWGACEEEWPQMIPAANQRVATGKVTTFEELYELMGRKAVGEPGRYRSRCRSDSQHSDPEEQEDGDAKSASGSQHPPPNSVRCWRCHKPGHRFAQCPKPETRACYFCGETGHVPRTCAVRLKKKSLPDRD